MDGQAEQSIEHVCDLTDLKQVREWGEIQLSSNSASRLLPVNLGMHCREWPTRKANAEVQVLLETNSKPHVIVVYDVSVTRD